MKPAAVVVADALAAADIIFLRRWRRRRSMSKRRRQMAEAAWRQRDVNERMAVASEETLFRVDAIADRFRTRDESNRVRYPSGGSYDTRRYADRYARGPRHIWRRYDES